MTDTMTMQNAMMFEEPTTEEIDQALAELGHRSLIPVEDIPSFLKYKGRIISETVHEGSIILKGGKSKSGKVIRYAENSEIADLLLDLRNQQIQGHE